MAKFILHGGGEMQRNEKHDDAYRRFIRNLPDVAKVLVVYFAITKEEAEVKHAVYEEYFRENSLGKEIELRVATEENFIEEIRWADGVYFRGGDTTRLLEKVKKHPSFKEEILKKKVVGGSSAGVYFLSKYAYSLSRDLIYEGLGILPIKVNCHFEDSKLEKVKQALAKYSGELVLLGEGEYKVMEVE